jgi:ABC-2 type transport system permease protein
MSTRSDTTPDSPQGPRPGASPSATRPFYWSVRRELWENRSLYMAPLAAGAVVLFGFSISAFSLARRTRVLSALDSAGQGAELARPYSFAALAIMLTLLLVGMFYCLGALHGERRDRSILFWKSLPVSDLTTVLAKASIPLVILPLFGFAIIVATQLIMLLLSTAILLLNGLSVTALWIQGPLSQTALAQLYSLAVLALWYAPIWSWLLLVSGWARRAVFLWAFLPPLALCVIEKIAFDSSNLASLLIYRLTGSFGEAYAARPEGVSVTDQLAGLDPVKFLSSPGLAIGLAVAAVFLLAAVWLRRRREPI